MWLLKRKPSASPSAPRLEIILYHFVSDQRNDFTLSGHSVTPPVFRRQLEYLSGRYTPVRLSEIPGLVQAAERPARPYAAVCFDDGYRCILSEAYPLLEEMRIPATMFVNPPVLGNRDLLWRDKIRYLIQKDLAGEFVAFLRSRKGAYDFGLLEKLGFYKWSKNPKALRNMAIQKDVAEFFAQKGFDPAAIASANDLFLAEDQVRPMEFLDFGNHTWSHPLMTLLTAAEQRAEIARCHDFLVGRGIRPTALALPFSPFNRDTRKVCRELGYDCLLTVYEESNFLPAGKADRPLVLHRWMAPKDAEKLASIV
jgi:peptidoglycan/xylan/chitin deacetylase (PgdA/CDA1 family)